LAMKTMAATMATSSMDVHPMNFFQMRRNDVCVCVSVMSAPVVRGEQMRVT
jgi:hypothetical protein